jgi:hypothetical protein
MKYYIYVSESKIDMLYSQIVKSDAERREKSVGLDFKFVKGEYKTSRGIPSNNLTKLNAIIDNLAQQQLVGSIHEQKPYIRGCLKLKWSAYEPSLDVRPPITFWGYISHRLALGLAGSPHHLLGKQADGTTDPGSATSVIINWLWRSFSDPPPLEDLEDPREREDYIVAYTTFHAAKYSSGHRGLYEFIAKVLHRSTWTRGIAKSKITEIILATPLYVAMVE